MAFQPELFTTGCDRPLPVDQVVDEYEIAEIIPLRVQVGDVDIAVLVNPFGGTGKTIDEYVDRGLYRRSDGTVHSYASVTGGVSVEHLAADDVKSSLQPLVESVRVSLGRPGNVTNHRWWREVGFPAGRGRRALAPR